MRPPLDRPQIPVHEQSIGWQIPVQSIPHRPVIIRSIDVANCTQSVQVQVSISGLEGIEGPAHQVEPLLPSHFALTVLQRRTAAVTSMAGKYAEHMRCVKVPVIAARQESKD